MKNIVAVGASAALVGLSTEDFVPVIEGRFGGKPGGEIFAKNMEALRQGYAYCQEHFLATIRAGERSRFGIPPLELPGDPKTGIPVALRRCYASGNDLTAMGRWWLAADSWPITPLPQPPRSCTGCCATCPRWAKPWYRRRMKLPRSTWPLGRAMLVPGP